MVTGQDAGFHVQRTPAIADVESVATWPGIADRRAGKSAGRRFETLTRAWRRRVLRPFLFASIGLVTIFSVAGSIATGQAKFWFGAATGCVVTIYIALRESPPSYIEKWRAGHEGERRTAQALAGLSREGWQIRHDLDGGRGTNIDHVAISEAGVYLLDSKNYSGVGSLEQGELRVRLLEDPDDGWRCRGMVPRMRAASAGLKEQIEAATGVRVWVQAVVVLWMTFPEGVGKLDDVVFVHGDQLADWLRERRPQGHAADMRAVAQFLEGASVATN